MSLIRSVRPRVVIDEVRGEGIGQYMVWIAVRLGISLIEIEWYPDEISLAESIVIGRPIYPYMDRNTPESA